MEILKVVGTITWHSPVEDDLPKEYGEYYTIDNYGEHRIMIFYPDGAWGGMNWDGKTGSGGMKSNADIKMWTDLLPVQ